MCISLLETEETEDEAFRDAENFCAISAYICIYNECIMFAVEHFELSVITNDYHDYMDIF